MEICNKITVLVSDTTRDQALMEKLLEGHGFIVERSERGHSLVKIVDMEDIPSGTLLSIAYQFNPPIPKLPANVFCTLEPFYGYGPSRKRGKGKFKKY